MIYRLILAQYWNLTIKQRKWFFLVRRSICGGLWNFYVWKHSFVKAYICGKLLCVKMYLWMKSFCKTVWHGFLVTESANPKERSLWKSLVWKRVGVQESVCKGMCVWKFLFVKVFVCKSICVWNLVCIKVFVKTSMCKKILYDRGVVQKSV